LGKRLSSKEIELYKRVDEILFYEWDPIGVSSSIFDSWARDEYYPYLPKVFKLVMKGCSVESIAAYLTDVSTKNMGLSRRELHDIKIAKMLLKVRESSGFQ
jgi:hypothetical protein